MSQPPDPNPLRRVFLTGATGFVGAHVASRLLKDDACQVIACPVRTRCGDGCRALEALNDPRITIIDGCDLASADTAQLAALIKGCSAVIHCAALYSWWQPKGDSFVAANEVAARKVAEAALEAGGVQVMVQVSTVLTLGKPPGYGTEERPLTESTPLGPPASRYAATKAAGDAAVLRLRRERGLPACVVHLACVVGRDPKLLDPARDVMRIAPLAGGKVPATIGGSTVFTYVDADDAADAIVRAAGLRAARERYLVGRERLTTAEYYGLISELSGAPPPRAELPLWLARAWSKASDVACRYITGSPPQAPPDLLATVSEGTLLFDSTATDRELGLTYQPIRESFAKAVALIKAGPPPPPAAASVVTEG